MTNSRPTAPDAPTDRELKIELLALDLTSCGRCTRTGENLHAAVSAVASVLRETGVRVRVEQHVVESAAQAERLRFVASPTIRLNGRDIAVELRESGCSDCGENCACGGGVNCRVWVWQGKEYLEAPRPMIAEALLKAYADLDKPAAAPAPYHLPENLRGFFAGLEARKGCQTGSGCCDPATACTTPACAC
jgi:hypothetical protein